MLNWIYDPTAYGKIKPLTPGQYRVRIEEAEEKTSKKGNEMIKLTLAVSGVNQKLFYYLPFLPDNRELTDRKLGAIFDSFGITPGDLNVLNWKGKVGAANVVNKVDDTGTLQAEISYFLRKSSQNGLPAWQEGNGKNGGEINSEMIDLGTPPF